jgi:hypothetical protein
VAFRRRSAELGEGIDSLGLLRVGRGRKGPLRFIFLFLLFEIEQSGFGLAI